MKKNRDKRLQHDIDIAVAKLSVLLSGKVDKYDMINIKQMLQRLPILLLQAKAGSTSENLMNEI